MPTLPLLPNKGVAKDSMNSSCSSFGSSSRAVLHLGGEEVEEEIEIGEDDSDKTREENVIIMIGRTRLRFIMADSFRWRVEGVGGRRGVRSGGRPTV